MELKNESEWERTDLKQPDRVFYISVSSAGYVNVPLGCLKKK